MYKTAEENGVIVSYRTYTDREVFYLQQPPAHLRLGLGIQVCLPCLLGPAEHLCQNFRICTNAAPRSEFYRVKPKIHLLNSLLGAALA